MRAWRVAESTAFSALACNTPRFSLTYTTGGHGKVYGRKEPDESPYHQGREEAAKMTWECCKGGHDTTCASAICTCNRLCMSS
jgi:hypothetical protein